MLCCGQDDDQDEDRDRLLSMILATLYSMGQQAYKHNTGRFSKRVICTKLRVGFKLRLV